jgi:hypothetical protein
MYKIILSWPKLYKTCRKGTFRILCDCPRVTVGNICPVLKYSRLNHQYLTMSCAQHTVAHFTMYIHWNAIYINQATILPLLTYITLLSDLAFFVFFESPKHSIWKLAVGWSIVTTGRPMWACPINVVSAFNFVYSTTKSIYFLNVSYFNIS